MNKQNKLSTVSKINIICMAVGVLLGLFFGLPLSRRLFPGSLWAQLIIVLWCGGFGYVIGYFINLVVVSRKFSGK